MRFSLPIDSNLRRTRRHDFISLALLPHSSKLSETQNRCPLTIVTVNSRISRAKLSGVRQPIHNYCDKTEVLQVYPVAAPYQGLPGEMDPGWSLGRRRERHRRVGGGVRRG